jgi:hypothetical protein
MLTSTRLGLFAAAVVTAAGTIASLTGTPPLAAATVPSQPRVFCAPAEVAVSVGGTRTCIAYTGGVIRADGEPLRIELRSSTGGAATRCIRRFGDDDNEGMVGPRTVPCLDSSKGWFSYHWDCYFREADEGTAIDPADPPPGYNPADPPGGLLYRASCYPPAGNDLSLGPHWLPGDPPLWQAATLVVLPTPPDGFGSTPPPLAELWVEAVNRLQLRGPVIATAPPLHTAGVVRLPTWLWTEQSPRVWGEVTATADARPGGVNQWVDVQAEARSITWDMGDGSDPTLCHHAGVEWEPGMESQGHGECSYRYLRSSRGEPDGVFPLTATTTWRVQWWVNGSWDGELELQVGSAADYRVTEIQVLVGQ